MRSYSYPVLLGVSALGISLCSAYYSVYGMGALFAGAALQIMIMAGALEFAKVVLAGFLHKFWKDLPILLRSYLSVAVIVLIVISSMGIYGYLASAYQSSSLELGSVQDKVQTLQDRKQRYTEQIASLAQEREGLTSTILTLSEGLTGNTVQYIDPRSGQVITTQSAAARTILQEQLTIARNREMVVSTQVQAFSDSLIVLDDRVFATEQASSASRNLGPLLFLSEVSGMSMDRVVNILIVIIMLVFDPLAVTMIVATSVSFDKLHKPVTTAENKPEPEPEPEFESLTEESEVMEPTSTVEPAQQEVAELDTFEDYFEPSQQELEQLESSIERRKVRQIKKIGNFFRITYEDHSVDKIHKDDYYKFINDNNLEWNKIIPT